MDKIFFNYDKIANLYDSFMSMVPYKIWAENIYNVYKSFNMKGRELIDLGAGTGNLSKHLSEYGFNVTLVDISIEMLKEAQKKNYKNISTFICCDIVNLGIKKKFDLAICMYDTINHITEENMNNCFYNVFDILKQNAIFIFDFNTEFGLDLMSKNSQVRDGDGFISFWETDYDHKSKICTLNLKVDFYNKTTESFVFSERAIFPEELENGLKKAGFQSVDFYDFSTMKKLNDYSERGLVVCRK